MKIVDINFPLQTVHGCLPKVNEKRPKYILIDEFKSGELIMYDLVRPQCKDTHEKLCDLVNSLNNKKLELLHKNQICVKNCNLCLSEKEVKTEMIKSIESKAFESKTSRTNESKYDNEYIDYHKKKLEGVRKVKRKRKGSDDVPKPAKKPKKSSATSTVIEDNKILQNISTMKSENSVIVKTEPLSYGEFTVAKQVPNRSVTEDSLIRSSTTLQPKQLSRTPNLKINNNCKSRNSSESPLHLQTITAFL